METGHFELRKTGELPGCGQSALIHTQTDRENRNNDDHLFMFYEDVVKDRPTAIRQVAEFLHVDLSDAEVDKINECNGVEWMKKHDRQVYWAGTFTPLAADGRMIRAGKADGGKKTLTVEQRRYVDQTIMKRLEEIGSDFPYKEKYASW